MTVVNVDAIATSLGKSLAQANNVLHHYWSILRCCGQTIAWCHQNATGKVCYWQSMPLIWYNDGGHRQCPTFIKWTGWTNAVAVPWWQHNKHFCDYF